MKPTSSPSNCERTGRTRMILRVIETSIGLSRPLRMILSLILVLARPLDSLIKREPPHRRLVEMGDYVIWHDAGICRGCSIDWGHDLNQAVLHRKFDTDSSKFAARLHLHLAETLGIHVARMRIEPSKHSIDRE